MPKMTVANAQLQLPEERSSQSRAAVMSSQRPRLLEAMANLVSQHGYASVRIEDITTQAGTAKRTFYTYFADKEACFLAIYDELIDEQRKAIENSIRLDTSHEERMFCITSALIDTWIRMGSKVRIFVTEAFSVSSATLSHHIEARKSLAELMVDTCREVSATNPKWHPMTEAHAQAVVGFIMGFLLQALQAPTGIHSLASQKEALSGALSTLMLAKSAFVQGAD